MLFLCLKDSNFTLTVSYFPFFVSSCEQGVLRMAATGNSLPKTHLPWFPRAKSWRQLAFRLSDDPDSSRAATAFSIVSSFAVILSCVALIISSLPRFRFPRYGKRENDTAPQFALVELFATVFFTAEYIVRIGSCSSVSYLYLTGECDADAEHRVKTSNAWFTRWLRVETQIHVDKTMRFAAQGLNIIDLLAILPFYLEVSGAGASVNLTSLRVGRLIRLAKLAKRNRMIPLLLRVLATSANLLLQIGVILVVFITFAACLIFICEQGTYNEESGQYERKGLLGDHTPSPYNSVYISMWWAIVTFTTVGYGDITPTTTAGRVVGALIILLSLMLVAVPVVIVTGVFIKEYGKDEARDDEKDNLDMHLSRALMVSEGKDLTASLLGPVKQDLERIRAAHPLVWLPSTGCLAQRVFRVFEDFDSCVLAKGVQSFVMLTIITSAVSLTVESLPQHRYPNHGTREGDSATEFVWVETVCVAIFTGELFLRAVSVGFVDVLTLRNCGYSTMTESQSGCARMCIWLRSPMTLVDIFSTAPFYLEILLPSTPSLTFLRVLRLLRMTRVVRLAKSMKGLVILTTAIEKSMQPLASLAVIFCVWIVFCSSIMFYCEQGEWSFESGRYERTTFLGAVEETPFQSIVDTFWWMVVTMTTVGYGDLYPTSTAGRLLGSIVLFLSIICLAVPISLVGVHIDKASADYIRAAQQRSKQIGRRSSVDVVGPSQHRALNHVDLETNTSESALDFFDTLFGLARDAEKTIRKMKDLINSRVVHDHKDVGGAREDKAAPRQECKDGRKSVSSILRRVLITNSILPLSCLDASDRVVARVQAAVGGLDASFSDLIESQIYGFGRIAKDIKCRYPATVHISRRQPISKRIAFFHWKSLTMRIRSRKGRMSSYYGIPRAHTQTQTHRKRMDSKENVTRMMLRNESNVEMEPLAVAASEDFRDTKGSISGHQNGPRPS